ncbi:MAG: MEKHLA domain-containing protein [Cytophagaceae bacterium]|jgi:hypothetical protein|nr:MEKHLA domain-containing protein [Cytophagaceae bacterium]
MEHSHLLEQTELICSSFFSLLGRDLISGNSLAEKANAMYYAPFVVVAHNTEADPVFFYANLTAQQLWGLSWDEFLSTPSRLTVEAMEVSERQKLLDRARQFGYVDDYTGIRKRKDGSAFEIGTTILWNLKDKEGNYAGQAAMFREWKDC